MESSLTKPILVIAGLAAAMWCPATARAQAETTPETYKSSGTAPMTEAPAAKLDYQGTFSLSQKVQCAGHKLEPGKYTLLVKTVGENKMVTLQHEGGDIVLTVKRAIQHTEPGKSAVLVRHGPGPGSHTLEAVYCEVLNMMFYLDESGHDKPMDKMFAGVKRLPMSKPD